MGTSINIMCGLSTIMIIYIPLICGQSNNSNWTEKRVVSSDFGFPEVDVHFELGDKKQNANNRVPLYFPSQCKDNELLYPGDQKDDWVCDCLPGYVFHPDTDQCYQLFTRGPCGESQYLALPQKKSIPDCIANPCKLEHRVPFRGRCHTLHTPGPCPTPELSYVVGVNVTTLNLDCIKLSVQLPSRFTDEDDMSKPLPDIIPICADGSKRVLKDLCAPSSDVFYFAKGA